MNPQEPDRTPQPSRVASTSEVALILAEELTAFDFDTLPGQRVAPGEEEAVLQTRPIEVVLDRLETKMSFEESHDWVMSPQPELKGLRPVEAVADGRVREVLSVIDAIPRV